MGRLGADADALDELARSMRAASRQLDHLALGLDRRTRDAGWSGPDAERFGHEWQRRHRPSLLAVGGRCSTMAATLESQAAQQRRASAASALPGTVASSAASPVPGAAAGRASGPVTHRVGSPAIEEAPLSERRYLGGIEVKAGVLTATLGGDVSVEELGNGRVRVTVAETGGMGVAAGFGATATVSVGDHTSGSTPTTGAQAEVTAGVAAVERRTWEVAEEAVPGLLVRIAAAEAIDAAAPAATATAVGSPGAVRAVRAVGHLFDAAARRVTGRDVDLGDRLPLPAPAPTPVRVERLVQVDAAAAAGATLLGNDGPAGRVAASGTLRAGRAVGPEGHSTIVEYRGGTSATLGATMLGRFGVPFPGDAGSVDGLRLELVHTVGGGPDHLIAKLSRTTGSRLDETTVRVELSETTGPVLHAVVGHLVGGAPTDALAALASLGSAGPYDDRVSVTTSSASLSGMTVRGGGSIAAGAGAGVSLHGRVIELERTG